MFTLYHYPFSPASRFVRLIIAEYGEKYHTKIVYPWEKSKQLLSLNAAGTIPVLVDNDGPALCSPHLILEYLDETRGYTISSHRLMPNHPNERAETRRLVEWSLNKFDYEVTNHIIHERIYKQEMPRSIGGGEPDSNALRIARINIKYHMKYFGYLISSRKWISGNKLSFADFALAAEFSCIDYLNEVPWKIDDNIKNWYARIKSRLSMRPILKEKILGIPPSKNYTNLDF